MVQPRFEAVRNRSFSAAHTLDFEDIYVVAMKTFAVHEQRVQSH
ncbi:MAG: hypothetical protein OXG05_15230 [Gammaproteobacteria bacterium]|nr:hypothetical protein [Gammaproteobacteria bacterium]